MGDKTIPEPAKEQVLSDDTIQTLSEKPLVEEVPLEKNNKKLLLLGLIIFTVIVLSSGLTFYFVNQVKPKQIIKTRVIQNKTPKKQEIVQLKREDITLEILNGSEIPGLAAKTAKKFTDLGYIVIKTGNTDSAPENSLYINNTYSGKLELLMEDVASLLKITSISGVLTDSSASAQIILGKK